MLEGPCAIDLTQAIAVKDSNKKSNFFMAYN
jgi:hypothetical protein